MILLLLQFVVLLLITRFRDFTLITVPYNYNKAAGNTFLFIVFL